MAKNQTYYKCAYPHCKHDDRKVHKDEAVKVGNRYWHPDCLAEKNAKLEIIDTWVKRIDPHPIFNLLRKIIDELVDKENNDAEYLLFALNYCLDNGWNLSYPMGLKYVSKDIAAKKAWEKRKENEIMKELREDMQKIADKESNSSWDLPEIPVNKKSNRTNISKILGV